MKKYTPLLCTSLLLLGITNASAQTPVVPTNLPVKRQPGFTPPRPLRIYSPADLAITRVTLNTITDNEQSREYTVTLSVTLRNGGELGSDAITKLKAFFTTGAGRYKAPTPYPLGANDPGDRIPFPWTFCAAEPGPGRIDGGASWTGNMVFEVPYWTGIHKGDKFYLLLLADFYNNTKESNEHNNYSTPLLITPPSH